MLRRCCCILLLLAVLTGLLPMIAVASDEVVESSNPPYAQIEYDYSPEVQCGTIRFINQMPSGSLFCSDYWKDWAWKEISGVYYGPSSECGTSCISMALSYVGVNKTPKDILDYGGGRTFFKDWGDASITKLSVSEFPATMENYINGNGRYSPPVIHLPNYSNRGHYVVVIGKIDDETYEILDPNNCAVTKMTIKGSSAIYEVRGDTIYDRIDSLCQWFNPEAAPALIQNVYPSASVVKTTEEIYAMSLPCGADQNAESQMLLMLKKEQTLHAVELVLNDWDQYWYKIEMPDKTICYVPSSKVEYQQQKSAQVTISDVSSPTALEAGESFYLQGKISAGNSRLTKVSVYVREGSGTEGEVILSGSVELNGDTFHLANSAIDSQMRFGKLTAGEYTYIIEAQSASYYAKDDTLKIHEETVILHEVTFKVVIPPDRNPPEQPVLKINLEKQQVSFAWDEVAHATHYHLLLQRKNEDGEWEDLERIKYPSGGLTRTLDFGVYQAQLIAYNENAWDNESDDWKHTHSEMVEFAVVCDHSYADGVVVQEATCKETGVMSFTCAICNETKEEPIAQLLTHTPGVEATATTDQRCLVCFTVLQEALGAPEPTEPEPTEETVPETQPAKPEPTEETIQELQPSEPVLETQEEDTMDIGAILALIVLGLLGICAIILEITHAVQKPQKTSETKEMQETQS